MRTVRQISVAFLEAILLSLALGSAVGATEKVILDTDMVMLYDDGVAMMMLANHLNVEMLGVTIVPGNTWVSEGAAYALRQLEAFSRSDVPAALGIRYPLRLGRYKTLHVNRETFGFNSS